jgi:hypothetical protein
VQHQPFGGRLVAAPRLQEEQQGLAQASVLLVVGGQAPQCRGHPGPQQFRAAEHHGHRRDLAERHHLRCGRSRGERDRLGGDGLLMGEPEPRRPASHVSEGEMQVTGQVRRAGRRGVEPVADAQRQPGPRAYSS